MLMCVGFDGSARRWDEDRVEAEDVVDERVRV